jgi:hypothetical protein
MLEIHFGPFRGVKLLVAPSTSKQIRYGLWERETYPYIRRAMRESDWVIDIGAGNGEHSIAFALRTSASPIIAIEPGSTEVLRANIDNNGVRDRITIDERSIGTAATHLDSIKVPSAGRGFIKLDADYNELDILNSGIGLLEMRATFLLIETHSSLLETETVRLLQKIGYRTHIIRNAWWRTIIPETRPSNHNRWLWAAP